MCRLLIVDDEMMITDGIEKALSESCLHFSEICKAYSATQALEKFRACPFDLVISDIRMPEMDGLEMTEEMKRLNPKLIAIFLTGFQDFEYARQALRLGARDYLLKPVPDEQLIDSVKRAMNTLQAESVLKSGDSVLTNSAIIEAIQKYITDHPDRNLSLTALSQRFRMNSSYLSRLFHQETGLPVSAYIIAQRIECAKKLLSATNLKVNDIARRVGFDNPNYFARVFKEKTGLLPTEYRLLY